MLLVPPSEAPVCVFFQGLSNTVVLCSSESSQLSDPASTLLLSVLFNKWGREEAEKTACSSTPKRSPPANLDISMPVFPKKSMVLLMCLKVSRCWHASPNRIYQARRRFVFFPLDSSPVRYTCSDIMLIKQES